jgi:putative colanic acid biosysnthesis UDP-glucose lipid carrier transferase
MPKSSNRTSSFFQAPQSVSASVAAFVEPLLTVVVFMALYAWAGEAMGRAPKALCFLAFALSFPGRNHFVQRAFMSLADITVSWLYLVLVLLICGIVTHSVHLFNKPVLLLWILLTPLVHWIFALMGRSIIKTRSAQRWNRRQVIVIGASELGLKITQALDSQSVANHDLLGFFKDTENSKVVDELIPKVLGTLEDVVEYLNTHVVHQIYITLPMGSQPRIVALMEALQDTTASLYLVPDVFGISIIQGRLQEINGVPVVGLCETPFTGINGMVKRVSDMVLASFIVVLTSPILLAVAIGVKLSSPGPVLFRQRRNGLDGEEILIYKFRSMRVMDDGAVVKQATKGDARITPFGAFIRKTSLDELPQFINVLQGRMSIVGPRPHAVAHNEQYRKLIRAYMVRHKVKPGITGWAQVNGQRGETDSIDKMQARVEYDLEYLRNWSLSFDLQIIFRTIRLVFFDRNAY